MLRLRLAQLKLAYLMGNWEEVGQVLEWLEKKAISKQPRLALAALVGNSVSLVWVSGKKWQPLMGSDSAY